MTEKRLKILHITPCFYPAWSYGGIPRVVYELSRELAKRGHDVEVYTTDVLDRSSRYHSGEERVDGVKAHYFRNLSNDLAYNFQVYLPRGFNSFVKKNLSGFDIIHLHGHRNFLNNIIHFYATRFNIPYVFSGHGTVPRIERRVITKRVFDMFFGNSVLRDAAHFVAVSRSEVEQFKAMGISEKKVRVIYNGVDIESFLTLPRKGAFREKYNLADKRITLFLGKITPRKGVDFLVKAFSELKRDDTVLVIAGNDMGFKSKVDEIVRERGVADKVIFTGLLVGEEKLSAYQDADVLVYPAVYEIFGLVPFEAIMCGTPVIVTDDCGCGEIIAREGIGYTVRYNDTNNLKETINEALINREEAERRVKKGIKFIIENLNWKNIGDKYIRLYRSIAR